MEKITVKELIKFRGKNDKSKITFVNNLKKEKQKPEGSSGGDYWISCLSALRNTFKYGNTDLLDEKIELLRDKINATSDKRIKDQFQRNLEIVNNFKDYDFIYLKPNEDLSFLKQAKNKKLLDIKDLPIEAKPCHIFSFSENNSEEIGGVWFIAQLNGFTRSELGMFADILYRYLSENYSQNFYVNPNYCFAVDLYNGQEVNFTELKNGNLPFLIDSTLENFKKI